MLSQTVDDIEGLEHSPFEDDDDKLVDDISLPGLGSYLRFL